MEAASEPRLPPEICDYVLDCFGPPLIREVTHGNPAELAALTACAQVCRSWLPRTQTHLYTHIHISNPNATSNLISTLARQPTLAARIRNIDVAAFRCDDYHPLLRLLPLAPQVQDLTLHRLDLNQNYPSSYITRLGRCTPVTTLALFGVRLPSLADLLRLIRSFPNLTSLRLAYPTFARETSATTIAELHAQRACWSPPRLRALEMFGSNAAGGLLQLLGREIEELQLELRDVVPDDLHQLEDVQRCLADYDHMRVFRYAVFRMPISFFMSEVFEDPNAQWMRDALRDFPGAVRSPALHSLHLAFDLAPYESRVRQAGQWSEPTQITFRYFKTRGALLDEALGRGFHDILVGMPAFPALTSLTLRLCEVAAAYDEAWWRKQVEARLPGVPPGAIRVEFLGIKAGEEREMYHYDRLWEPNPDTARVSPEHDEAFFRFSPGWL